MNPKISVVLPVYNGAAYLAAAIESILSQEQADLELIIIDDGSKDDSASVVKAFQDPRIRFYQQENRGLAATLNRGITLSAGEYIARQDQDDISLAGRLKKQADLLDANPGCALVGTRAEIWAGDTRTTRVHNHPSDNHTLKFDLLFDNPFVHSSVMLRKTAIDAVGLYSTDSNRQPPEDYELWSRIARVFEVANVPEMLLVYREFPGSMSRDAENPFLEKVIKISIENMSWYLGTVSPAPAIVDLARLAHGRVDGISPKPDFAYMRKALLEISSKIASSPSEEALLREKAINMVRSATLQVRCNGQLWRILRGIKDRIRSVIRKVKT